MRGHRPAAAGRVAAVLAIAAGLLTAWAAAGQIVETDRPARTWFAEALARGAAGGINVTYFWSRNAKLRAETVVAGHKVVTIVNGEHYYAYDDLQKIGVDIRRAPEAIARDRPDRRPFGNELEALLSQGAEKVGEQSLAGRPCELYRVTDSRGRRSLWVTKDAHRLPVRIEIFNRVQSSTQYTDYLNWLQGLAMPDAFFAPEPGIELEPFTLESYLARTAEEGPVGPVPILYADLLHGRPGEFTQ